MAFRLIDVENWERKEVYTHFMEEAVCSYAVNVELDITALKGQKLYPAMLWLLTDTVNEFPQFRTHLSPEGVGIFDDMTPSYTIFNEERKSFSSVWTPFDPDYQTFLRRYLADVERYKTSPHYRPKPGAPENCFDVSMVPWLSFTGFHLNLYGSGKYLLPIFTMGKFVGREGRRLLPLAVQVHHAACDGYHVGKFVERLQEKIYRF